MVNLQILLLRFFEPVMDVAYSKVCSIDRPLSVALLTSCTYIQIDKVDPEYFRKSKRLDISEETKIRGTKEEADAFFAAPPSSPASVNFITDVFFLACAIQHVGLGKTVATRGDQEKRLSDLEKDLKRVEADDSWRGVNSERTSTLVKLSHGLIFELPSPFLDSSSGSRRGDDQEAKGRHLARARPYSRLRHTAPR